MTCKESAHDGNLRMRLAGPSREMPLRRLRRRRSKVHGPCSMRDASQHVDMEGNLTRVGGRARSTVGVDAPHEHAHVTGRAVADMGRRLRCDEAGPLVIAAVHAAQFQGNQGPKQNAITIAGWYRRGARSRTHRAVRAGEEMAAASSL
jgi:hypothetical protein